MSKKYIEGTIASIAGVLVGVGVITAPTILSELFPNLQESRLISELRATRPYGCLLILMVPAVVITALVKGEPAKVNVAVQPRERSKIRRRMEYVGMALFAAVCVLPSLPLLIYMGGFAWLRYWIERRWPQDPKALRINRWMDRLSWFLLTLFLLVGILIAYLLPRRSH